jgi:hypothetical protein
MIYLQLRNTVWIDSGICAAVKFAQVRFIRRQILVAMDDVPTCRAQSHAQASIHVENLYFIGNVKKIKGLWVWKCRKGDFCAVYLPLPYPPYEAYPKLR